MISPVSNASLPPPTLNDEIEMAINAINGSLKADLLALVDKLKKKLIQRLIDLIVANMVTPPNKAKIAAIEEQIATLLSNYEQEVLNVKDLQGVLKEIQENPGKWNASLLSLLQQIKDALGKMDPSNDGSEITSLLDELKKYA